ncbi:MAG TPA: M56 family metallopeptidase [Micromonosporaceae bacterium]|nr:M56 family metallopeptidase [Micromonosporaceae bacterium]
MVYAAHFAAALIACYLTAQVLMRSRWTWRIPGVAIVCWQAIGLAFGLSTIGLLLSLGLAPYGGMSTGAAARRFVVDLASGDLPAGLSLQHLTLAGIGFGVAAILLGATVHRLVTVLLAQRRHRELLALVARDDPAVPGALVLDHTVAAAYCLPGWQPRVVVSAGALTLLDRSELAAVLSHERAHAEERHDLVLLPFSALRRALPFLKWVRAAHDTVALLVEMRADDKARRLHDDGPLRAALLRFAETPVRVSPTGTLGIADGDLDARMQRLLEKGRPPRVRGAVALAVAAALVYLPISLYLG